MTSRKKKKILEFKRKAVAMSKLVLFVKQEDFDVKFKKLDNVLQFLFY